MDTDGHGCTRIRRNSFFIRVHLWPVVLALRRGLAHGLATGLRSEIVAAKPASPTTSESVDDYLKAILELGGTEELRVTTNALAERLNVRTPSVTGMLQRLA